MKSKKFKRMSLVNEERERERERERGEELVNLCKGSYCDRGQLFVYLCVCL